MSRSRSGSRSAKRVKLDQNTLYAHGKEINIKESTDEEEDSVDCTICLQHIVNRTVIPKCSHEFCFECLLVWTEQSRSCPLCSQTIGEYLIHSIRSKYDYRKHYLAPLSSSPPPSRPVQSNVHRVRHVPRRLRQERAWGMRERDSVAEMDKLEHSILKRRWIYEHNLYAKHVASNAFTKYRPYPTPAQFAASQDFISRTIAFLRRELQVWENLDIEFLTSLITSLMKAIDIRSESAVKLLSEFLDIDEPYVFGGRHQNAEHFAHEVYCYVRSPFKDLFVYDSVVQYDSLPVAILHDTLHDRRWHHREYPLSSRLHGESPISPRECRRASESSENPSSRSPSGRKRSRSGDPSASPRRACKSKDSKSSEPNSDTVSDNRLDDVHHEPQQTSRDRLTPSVGSDAKGKGRANSLQPSVQLNSTSEQQPSFSDRNQSIQGHVPRTAETINTTAKSRRPSRNKSLLESVKAHLAMNGSTSSGSHTRFPRDHDLASIGSLNISEDPLSQLSRLTDPSSNRILIPTKSPLEKRSSAQKELSMAYNKGPTAPLSLNQDNSVPEQGQHAMMSPRESRTLNREKRQVLDSQESSHLEYRETSLPTVSSSRVTTSPRSDLDVREASLRTQAQLRTRLAAEKRLTAASGEP